jgi:hypothetical protein
MHDSKENGRTDKDYRHYGLGMFYDSMRILEFTAEHL